MLNNRYFILQTSRRHVFVLYLPGIHGKYNSKGLKRAKKSFFFLNKNTMKDFWHMDINMNWERKTFSYPSFSLLPLCHTIVSE